MRETAKPALRSFIINYGSARIVFPRKSCGQERTTLPRLANVQRQPEDVYVGLADVNEAEGNRKLYEPV